MEIGSKAVEKEITLDDSKPFLSKQDVPAGDTNTHAYILEGADGYVIGIPSGTIVAPEFRDVNGDKLDPSTRVTIQACDKQGNPIGSGVVFSETLDAFRYDKMRTDPDYFRKTQATLMVDEREIVKVFVDIPDGANGFSASESRLTIGDDTSDFANPVEIVDHDDLSGNQSQAVKDASRATKAGGR